MTIHKSRHAALIAGLAALALAVVPGPASAQRSVKIGEAAAKPIPQAAPETPNRPRDVADDLAGSYFGNVMSDARGGSQSDVRITVTRVGKNRVRIESDYARLPTFEANVTRVMDSIQNNGGDAVVLLEAAKSPQRLYVTVDDAAWSGLRE